MDRIVVALMDEYQLKLFKENKDIDLAYSIHDVGRFRVNIYNQRNSYGMVMRYIPFVVPQFETLDLPDVIKTISLKERG